MFVDESTQLPDSPLWRAVLYEYDFQKDTSSILSEELTDAGPSIFGYAKGSNGKLLVSYSLGLESGYALIDAKSTPYVPAE